MLMCLLQDSYRKLDVISKAEFDSQRGSEGELEAESDLVFGPLDQEDVAAAPSAAAAPAKLEEQRSAEPEAGHRGRVQDGEGRRKLSSNSSPTRPTHQRRKKDRTEKRARFYPVLNKQDSPSKVRRSLECDDFTFIYAPLRYAFPFVVSS